MRILKSSNVELRQFLNDTVQTLVLSSFVYDWEWLETYLKDIKGHIYSLAHSSTAPKATNRTEIVPFVHSFGCMHIKMMLIFYSQKLRVVISSANLMRLDWEVLDNLVCFQDFPLRDGPANAFQKDLKALTKDMKLPLHITRSLDNFDFTKAKGKLVISKPGKYSSRGDYGMLRLYRIVKEMAETGVQREVYYQTSSLGSTSETWIRDFYNCCIGLEPPSLSLKRKREENMDFPPFRILFPSQDTVFFSKCKEGAFSICFNRKYWKKFPKQVLRHAHSSSGGLMHSKVLLSLEKHVLPVSGKLYLRDEGEPGDSWIYIGSHNCTLSAWGSITKTQDIFIRNWELGIVFGVSDIISDDEIPIPFVFPPKTYLPDQEPWVFRYVLI